MKKILVIGSGGAGKSTFARRLGERLGIEVVHLDQIYWRPGWNEPDKAQWRKLLESHLEKDAWILDGNFGSTLAMRLEKCDTVVYLEMPRLVCLGRVLKRFLKYRGRTRPDMGAGCNEKIDREFLRWIWEFPEKDGRRVERILKEHGRKADIIRLRTKRETENFFAALQSDRGFNV